VDQGWQERRQMDEALLPHVQRQSDAVATVCPGVQPGQLSVAAGFAETSAALVADDAAGETHQDRCQGDAARQVRHVPTGRSGGNAAVVCVDSRPDRPVGDSTTEHVWMCELNNSTGENGAYVTKLCAEIGCRAPQARLTGRNRAPDISSGEKFTK